MNSTKTPNGSFKLNQQLDRYFLACSALVGVATLAGTHEAKAEVIYSGVKNITVPLTNGAGGIYLNLETHDLYIATTNGNGGQPLPGYIEGWDINPYYIGGRPRIYAGNDGSMNATNGFPSFGINAISLFTGGEMIDGSLTYANTGVGSRQMVNSGLAGPWVSTTGYSGIQFMLADSSMVYGWLRVSAGGSGGIPLTIIDWAYEDTGAGIIAGAVPEPSSVALGCLAAGAVGLAAWRKRKQA